MVEKALEIDPTLGGVKWLIERVAFKEAFPDWPEKDDLEGWYKLNEMKADMYAACALTEPGNAYYPLFEASIRFKLEQDDQIMPLIKQRHLNVLNNRQLRDQVVGLKYKTNTLSSSHRQLIIRHR